MTFPKRILESYGVVVSFVFLLKTSRVRTHETSQDYCKLSSGDVSRWRWGGMRALHYPVPNRSKNKEKYHMGCSDHWKIQHCTPSKAAFNKPKVVIISFFQVHYCSMITYFKSFQRQVKWAGMFTQIIVNGSFKIPTKT